MAEGLSPSITKRLTDFVLALRYEDMPVEVIAEAKKALLDTLGVALIGSKEESTRMLGKTFESLQSRGQATVLGTDIQASPTVAALINGYAAHALDYDDAQHGIHMSAPVLPTALAAAEMLQRSGKDLLTAYVTGFEVGSRLARVARFGRQLSGRGIHATGVLGHFGAVAAAGRLMELNASQMGCGFGIAASQASGLLRSFGTMCKPLHAGNAAHDALLAALLAKQGFTGPAEIFDGEQNIFAVYDGRTDPETLVRGLGQHFEIMHNTLKVFACAGWRNPIMEALIHIVTTHELQPSDVENVQLWAHKDMMQLPNYPQPRTGLEGKFSVEHAAAVALVDRAGGVAQFTDVRVTDPALAQFRRRITIEADDTLEPYQIRALVHTVAGHQHSHFVPAQKGDARNPLSWDELLVKFRANATEVLSTAQVDPLSEMVQSLEGVADVSELTRLCRAAPPSS